MPMWRCPHCATPQAETARCWVCHRSSTACGACRNFRRGVAGHIGYCGLDRARQPLSGDEIRPCWEAADATGTSVPALPGVGPVWPLEPDEDRTDVQPLQFIEVRPATPPDGRAIRADRTERPRAADAGAPDAPIGGRFVTPSRAEPRWSLWGETEP